MAFLLASSPDTTWMYPLIPPTMAGEMRRIIGLGEALPECLGPEAPASGAVVAPGRAGEAAAKPLSPPPSSSGSMSVEEDN